MRIFDEEFVGECRNKFGIGRRGIHRGFGSVMGFLTDQFDERIIEKFLGRGEIKYLILNSLGKKPMHGYEIITDIEKDFQNLYSPSPGAIYPTLQMLEEAGLIKGEEKDSKKVYELTKKGEKELSDNASRINEILSRVAEHREKHWFGREMRNLSEEYASLGSSVFFSARKAFSSGEKDVDVKLKKIGVILEESRKKILQVWSSS